MASAGRMLTGVELVKEAWTRLSLGALGFFSGNLDFLRFFKRLLGPFTSLLLFVCSPSQRFHLQYLVGSSH